MMVCALSGHAIAQRSYEQALADLESNLQPLTPTYLDGVYQGGGWRANWFFSVKGGFTAFVGDPVGHGDFFDRTKPLLNVSFGKWLTPHIGARISYQGLQFLDSDIEARYYQNYHADLMYNVAAFFQKESEELPRWNVVPYIGFGFIKNQYTKNKPFAFSYGVNARYRLTRRLHLSAEIGGTTTWRDFDGYGDGEKLGDNLLQASIGLDLTIGKVGWRRVVDAKPYIVQNDLLIEYLNEIKNENYRLNILHDKEAQSIAEMRKILEIEGLIDKYHLNQNQDVSLDGVQRNNYSGLNALRARLRNGGGRSSAVEKADTSSMNPAQYFQMMQDGKVYVGTPIFFFFKISTTDLIDKSQVLNIKEIARISNKYGLHVRVVGAADKKTGSEKLNYKLSVARAKYIAKQLQKYGVPENMILVGQRGGIDAYNPLEGNRNTRVLLYFK